MEGELEATLARKIRRKKWWTKRLKEGKRPTRRVGDAESEGHPSVARKTTGKIGVAKCPPFPAMSGSQAGFRLSSGREIFARRGVSSSKAVDSGCCEEREDSSSSADSSEETGVLSTKEEEMDLESRLSDTPVANKQSETRKVDFSSKSTSFSSKSISSKKKFSPLPRTREQTRESSASKSSGKHRYIAFIGNLPFNAHSEDVASHFNKKGVVTTQVRLLTDKKSGQSRGCCFVEFPNAKTLQNALKFHQTLMHGRRVNIEVTCGGGGKGEMRTRRIRERNEKLSRSRTSKRRKESRQQ